MTKETVVPSARRSSGKNLSNESVENFSTPIDASAFAPSSLAPTPPKGGTPRTDAQFGKTGLIHGSCADHARTLERELAAALAAPSSEEVENLRQLLGAALMRLKELGDTSFTLPPRSQPAPREAIAAPQTLVDLVDSVGHAELVLREMPVYNELKLFEIFPGLKRSFDKALAACAPTDGTAKP
jgi:hypothetical protein